MRLVVGTLSAVLLSGCSWFGAGSANTGFAGSGYGSGYGCANTTATYGGQYGYGVQNTYGANGCAGSSAYGFGTGVHGLRGAHGLHGARGLHDARGVGAYGANFGGTGVHGLSVQGLGVQGLGVQGYGTSGAAGMGAYGFGSSNVAGTATMLGNTAPYGAAVGGATISGAVPARQLVNGQLVNGHKGYGGAAGGYGMSSGVTTIQGAPIFIPQPYPAYYGVGVAGSSCCGAGGFQGYGAGGLRGGFAALPFGLEASIGTEIGIGGDIFPGAPAKPAGTNFISAIAPIGYSDAYKNAVNYQFANTYDINPSTTILGQLGYSKAEGQRLKIGTINDGVNPAEDLYAQWGDLKQVTLEGGVRKYVGGWNNTTSGVRPYIQAMAGFTHNKSVNLVQDSAILAPAALNTQQYIQAGWTPTATGLIGAEMQVGARTAIGVETGIRWRDGLNTNLKSGDRWSIPLKVRGRVSF